MSLLKIFQCNTLIRDSDLGEWSHQILFTLHMEDAP
jgi:hypothetical protein